MTRELIMRVVDEILKYLLTCARDIYSVMLSFRIGCDVFRVTLLWYFKCRHSQAHFFTEPSIVEAFQLLIMKFLTTSVSSCPWLGSDGRHFIRYESTIHLKLSLIMLIAIDKLMFMFDNWLLWPRLTKARLFFLIPIFFEMTKLMMTLQMLLTIVVNGAWQTRNTENLLANPSKLRSCHFSLQATQCFKSICIFHKRGM